MTEHLLLRDRHFSVPKLVCLWVPPNISTAFDLIQKSTPGKKKLFEAYNLSTQSTIRKSPTVQKMGQRLIDAIHRLKKRNFREDRLTRKFLLSVCSQMGSARLKCLLLNISKNTALHHDIPTERKRWENKAKEVHKLAKSFLEDTATQIPNKKLVRKKLAKGHQYYKCHCRKCMLIAKRQIATLAP